MMQSEINIHIFLIKWMVDSVHVLVYCSSHTVVHLSNIGNVHAEYVEALPRVNGNPHGL